MQNKELFNSCKIYRKKLIKLKMIFKIINKNKNLKKSKLLKKHLTIINVLNSYF
jgi:hypothetical protein